MPVDSPLCQAVARSAGATGGWNAGAADEGDAAGRSGQSSAGQYLSASRVRRLDAHRHIQTCRSSGTPTISSRTARRRRRRSRSWRASDVDSRSCRLEVHPDKTRIVYCKDDDRTGRYPKERFDFLGYTFRPRRSKNRWGKFFINFTPAVSNEAATKMRQEMRRWRIPLRSDKAIDDLARMWNPVLRGWIQYLRSLLSVRVVPDLSPLQRASGLAGPCGNTRGFSGHRRRAEHWLGGVARREPRLFAHWQLLGVRPAAG